MGNIAIENKRVNRLQYGYKSYNSLLLFFYF